MTDERQVGLLERIAREAHGKGYTDSAHVRYVNLDEGQGGGRWEHWPFDACPHPDCVDVRAALALAQGQEYESCERTHAPETTHYHPLRVKHLIDDYEDKRAQDPRIADAEGGFVEGVDFEVGR